MCVACVCSQKSAISLNLPSVCLVAQLHDVSWLALTPDADSFAQCCETPPPPPPLGTHECLLASSTEDTGNHTFGKASFVQKLKHI